MNPANLAFLVILVLAVAAWVLRDSTHRARRVERKAQRAELRAVRRAERVVADAEAKARQEVFDVLHRHYRTQRRLIMAGHDPRLAGPVRLPGLPVEPQRRQAATGERPPESSSRQSPS